MVHGDRLFQLPVGPGRIQQRPIDRLHFVLAEARLGRRHPGADPDHAGAEGPAVGRLQGLRIEPPAVEKAVPLLHPDHRDAVRPKRLGQGTGGFRDQQLHLCVGGLG